MNSSHCLTTNAHFGFAHLRAVRTLTAVLLTCVPGVCFATAVPSIQELKPASATSGGASFVLTVIGDGIDASGKVSFNGSLLGITSCSGTQCQVAIPAGLIASPTTATVAVVNSDGHTSNSVLFPIATPEAQVSFATKTTAVGKAPQGLARGDFNGDGIMDLAVVNSGDNTVSILLGDGMGNFTPFGTAFAVGHNPQGIVAGDFNNDGNLDLAVTNENDNTVTIFLGAGNGTFSKVSTTVTTDIAPVAIAAADIDQDGKLDLLVVNQTGGNAGCQQGDGSLSTYTGNGDGTFNSKQEICLGILPSSIAVGDLSGNGLPDIVINNQGGGGASCATGVGSVTVLVNFGGGLFDFFGLGVSSFCAGSGPTAVALADFNNDGNLDLAVTNVESNAVSILLGNGDGSFQSAVSYSNGGGLVSNSLVAGDFNGDGNIDLALANEGSSNISILIGNGDGTFQEGPLPVPPPSVFSTVDANNHGRSPVSIAAVDANRDGRLDIVTVDNNDGYVSIMTQAPAIVSTCNPPPPNPLPNPPPAPPTCVATSTPSLVFGNQPDGTSSNPLSVQIMNDGGDPLTIKSIGVTGANGGVFTQTNTCGSLPAVIPAGGTCDISVVFAPTTIGTLSGSAVTVGLSDGSSQSVASLSGSGLASVIGFSPQTVTFPATLVGTTSPAPVTVMVSNIGDFATVIETLSVGGLGNPSDFMILNDGCSGQTLAAGTSGGGTCMFQVSFTPSGSGLRTATLNFPYTLSGSTSTIVQTIPLSGDGAAPSVLFSPTPLTFGNQPVSTTSGPQSVTLLNDGTYPLTLASVASSDPSEFTITNNNCPMSPSTLAVSTSCTIALTFTPSATGTRNANLTFTDNNNAINGSQQVVGLVGTGAAADVSLAVAPATFGNQQVGTTSASATITLSNIGNGPLTIASILKGGTNSGDFAITGDTCPMSPAMLGISASCTVTLTFTPSAPGARSATVTFTDNNNGVVGSQQTVTLAGTGTAPAISLVGLSAGSALAFGGVPIGTTSAPLSFQIANTGTAPLIISSIVSSDLTEYVESDTCGIKPASVPANGICTVSVTFTPSATGSRPATLTIRDNNGGSPSTSVTQIVNLSGTGTNFTISASPATVTVSPGKFASYTLTLTPVSGFTGTVSLGCNVTPALPKTTCTTPISVVVSSPNTMVISASAKNSSKGTFTLGFSATFTATAPAAGSLSHSTSAKLTVK